ncbi:Gfo/Idh/MocA family protein [Bremerella sp. T1]|uniref:Gfo/Idh/MocA family protein n=1 Tax=Bremerella sp. TYQ1 TaxID=3119568 RepID=UPI001CCAFC07|nr:Gfo/Idh/MocA family oxidoreductase [Bremerella volcania]UBM36694.1 Gfo/Idh/MocA family oxidoreductase [Bremerella volcania]
MNHTSISRRKFVGAAGALTALGWSSLIRGESPANRIRIGVIGTGVRGKYLIGNLSGLARVTAICDCAKSRVADTLNPRHEFAQILGEFRDQDANHCNVYQDYRRMLDREPLDAVVIATPDHHHIQAAMIALQAGLDVYVEKPLSLTVREGRMLADMVKRSERTLQVGSQQRTMEMNQFACEFIRDGGLGEIRRVDSPNYPGPISSMDFASEPVPKDLDWELFLGPSPARPHNQRLWVKDVFKVGDLLWRGWDLFRDYSGHLMTNWGAHNIDMIQYALGMDDSGPIMVAPLNSDTIGDQELDISETALERDWLRKWHNKTPRPNGLFSDSPRFLPVTMKYANGTVLNFLPDVPTAIFYGERGTMEISRNKFKVDPIDLVKELPDPSSYSMWQGVGIVARPHLEDWLNCIRTGDTPNAPVEVGHRSATVCHLANIAREINRPLQWNPASERFVNDDEGNALLDRPRRSEFELP